MRRAPPGLKLSSGPRSHPNHSQVLSYSQDLCQRSLPLFTHQRFWGVGEEPPCPWGGNPSFGVIMKTPPSPAKCCLPHGLWWVKGGVRTGASGRGAEGPQLLVCRAAGAEPTGVFEQSSLRPALLRPRVSFKPVSWALAVTLPPWASEL